MSLFSTFCLIRGCERVTGTHVKLQLLCSHKSRRFICLCWANGGIRAWWLWVVVAQERQACARRLPQNFSSMQAQQEKTLTVSLSLMPLMKNIIVIFSHYKGCVRNLPYQMHVWFSIKAEQIYQNQWRSC